jgi:ABC-type transport system substrate-binding protein
MYTKNGFAKFNVTQAKAHVAAYKAATGAQTLSFSYPTDTSTASIANAKFLQTQWAKCGITANLVTEETAAVISKAFNSSQTGGAQMGYDALSILLFEGTDVAFNLPFVVTNTFKNNPLGAAFRNSLGTLLNLNHHVDTAVDTLLFDGEAAQTKAAAAAKYKAGLAYLQSNGFMTAVQRQYYTLFTSKKLGGVGTLKFKLSNGKTATQRVVTNWGIDWTGVYKK